MLSLPSLLLALGPALAPLTASPLQPEAQTANVDRESLQEFLERLRKERDAYLASLKDKVNALLKELEDHAEARRRSGLESTRKKLVALGPEAAPLLVEAIEPGVGASRAQRGRSAQVAKALGELPTTAVTQRLITIAKTGTVEGRTNALDVLATNPDPERVSPTLVDIYGNSTGTVREAALRALARQGGSGTQKILAAALKDEDTEIVTTALRALTQAKNESIAKEVLAIAQDKAKAREHVAEILAYFRACPKIVGKAHLATLLRMAADERISENNRVGILGALPDFDSKFDGPLKKELKDMSSSLRRDVAQAAQISLVVLGDSRAKKDLLRPFNDAVNNNKDWSDAYENRGEIYYRIRDYAKAVKDFNQALKLSKRDPRPDNVDIFLGLARSYAQLDKFKDAYNILNSAPVSVIQLRALGGEPVFEEMREHPRYGSVFRLGD